MGLKKFGFMTEILTKLPADMMAHRSKLQEKTISLIGYGNQGRSQAQNLRDNGFKVIIGNVKDDYYTLAKNDGFTVSDISAASSKGDILFILIPDEVQPAVFKHDIEPNLAPGKTLVFASGYNYFYGLIEPTNTLNVLMLAPRMIGWGIRDLFLKKRGYPVLGAVGNDYSGDSKQTMVALADGIGALNPGGCVISSSFREETLLDLLSEHSWVPSILFIFRAYYELVTELGCSPEAAILEMYASGELAEIAESMKEIGLFKQLKTHSHTSQYGSLTFGPKYINDDTKKLMRKFAYDILDGTFAREWTSEQATGMIVYRKLHEINSKHPMEKEEDKLYKLLKRRN
jgi:ketol-acid reductoisomerase